MQNPENPPSCLQLVWREPGEGQGWPAAELWGSWTGATAHTCRQTCAQTYTRAQAWPPMSQVRDPQHVSHLKNKIPKHLANKSFIEAPPLSDLGKKKVSTFQAYFVFFIFHFILLLPWHMHFQVKENTWSELHLMHHEGILCAPVPIDYIETVKWAFPVCIFSLHTDLPLYFFLAGASIVLQVSSSTDSPSALFKQPHPLSFPPPPSPKTKRRQWR